MAAKEPIVLPDESKEAIDNTIDFWIIQLGAETDAECAQIENMVHAQKRIERCVRSEDAAGAKIYNALHDGYDDRQAETVQAAVEGMAENPADSLRKLRNSTCGIIHLLGEWGLLSGWLKTHPSFEPSQRVRAIHMCGRRPCDLFRDEVILEWDRNCIGGLHGNGTIEATDAALILKNDRLAEITTDEFERLLKPLIPTLPGVREAQTTLKELIAGVIEELNERLDLVGLRQKRDLEVEVQLAETDVTRDGMNRNHYRRENERAANQAIHTFYFLKEMRLKYADTLTDVADDDEKEPEEAAETATAGTPEPAPGVEIMNEATVTQVAGGAEAYNAVSPGHEGPRGVPVITPAIENTVIASQWQPEVPRIASLQ